jgi:hypothetical protein
VRVCAYQGTGPFRSSAQISCRLMTKSTSIMRDLIYMRFQQLPQMRGEARAGRQVQVAHIRFICLDPIPSRLYRRHCALSRMCRPQIKGKGRRRTNWSISALNCLQFIKLGNNETERHSGVVHDQLDGLFQRLPQERTFDFCLFQQLPQEKLG